MERAEEKTRAAGMKADFREVTDDGGGCAEQADGRYSTRKPKPALDPWPSERWFSSTSFRSRRPNARRSPAGTRTGECNTLEYMVLRVPVRCSACVRPLSPTYPFRSAQMNTPITLNQYHVATNTIPRPAQRCRASRMATTCQPDRRTATVATTAEINNAAIVAVPGTVTAHRSIPSPPGSYAKPHSGTE